MADQRSNMFTPQEIAELEKAFLSECFDYQLDWYRAGNQRTRAILKSRQIGATYYFAREALLDALITGRNQIFLSASKNQAHIFKAYIQAFVVKVLGRQLSGEPIVLGNGAELHFCGAKRRTFGGLSGNVYVDEFFWIHPFNELNKVIAGMAARKPHRKTYFSSLSIEGTESMDFWAGNGIDVNHGVPAEGRLCKDGIWRQIVTILDAEARGCVLFDIEELRRVYSAHKFEELFMCRFKVEKETHHA